MIQLKRLIEICVLAPLRRLEYGTKLIKIVQVVEIKISIVLGQIGTQAMDSWAL